jgi:hypothetical protein
VAPAPAAAQPPAAPSVVVVTQTPTSASPEQVTAQPPPPAASGGSALAIARWTALGLGVAALGVGVFGAVQHSDRLATFDKTCSIDAMGRAVNDVGMPDAACDSKKSAYESSTRLAVGGFIAGGALVATGVILWLVAPRATSTDTAALACAPSVTGRGGAGLGCTLRF